MLLSPHLSEFQLNNWLFFPQVEKTTSMYTLSPQKFKKWNTTFSVSYLESFLIKIAHNMPPDSPTFFLGCIA